MADAVHLGRIVCPNSFHLDPLHLGPRLLRACRDPVDITSQLTAFEEDYWGARRAPDTRDALVSGRLASWTPEQPRPRAWVQQLGIGRAVLDAGGSSAEHLWHCANCARWSERECVRCGADLVASAAGAKRRRVTAGGPAKACCPQLPIGGALGRTQLKLCVALDAKGRMVASVTVKLQEQLRVVARALHWRPLCAQVHAHLVSAHPTEEWDSEAYETPTDQPSLELPVCEGDEECASLDELVPGVEPPTHRPAQAAAVAWALQRDADGTWETERRFLLACHPQQDAALQVRLSAIYSCRGGVLAQTMGTGKTLAALCLVAARPAPVPTRSLAPDLPRVRCTIILAAVSNVAEGTWEDDARRHLCALHPPFRMRTVATPKQLREVSVAELERLDAIVMPQTAMDWACFNRGMSDPPRADPAYRGEQCEHLRRCLHFQRSRGSAVAADIRASPARASAWTLADLGIAGVHWERIIVDELPEVLVEKPWTFGKALLQAIEAPRRWGLTATPKLDARGLQAVCDFLRVSAASGTASQWSSVAGTLFRTGSWDTTAIQVTHVTHRVRLSGLERAVYESEYARAHASARADRMASCVRKCTHWRDSADSPEDDALTLPQACERSLAALNQLIEDRSREAGESIDGGAAYLPEVHRAQQEELTRLRTQGKYVSAVFQTLTQSPCEECPICLMRFQGTEVRLITPCGHVFHEGCLEAARVEGTTLRCPSCREPVTRRLPLRCPLPAQPLAQSSPQTEVVLQPIKMRPQSGDQRTSSKIACLACFLKRHSDEWRHSGGVAGKVLVLVQWSDMRLRLEEALCAERVPFVAHKGQMPEARDNLQAFLREDPASPVVLLATFERRLGINVQRVAAHVVLVHPFVGSKAVPEGGSPSLRPEQAEEQALARVVRPGQSRPVCLHRFVGADTVEENMVAVAPEVWHFTQTVES